MRAVTFSLPLCTLLAVLALGIIGCGGGKEVARIDTGTVTDLSGEWNDTDSRLVAEEMIRDVLSRPWLDAYTRENKKNPTVIVGRISNRSHEHIETKTFTKDLERELLNSGKVDFVAAKDERGDVREEIEDQAMNASEDTQKAPGQETGADFMVLGNISSIIDQEGGTKVKFYQVNMELVQIGSNKKVWIGEKKIKKVVSQGSVKF